MDRFRRRRNAQRSLACERQRYGRNSDARGQQRSADPDRAISAISKTRRWRKPATSFSIAGRDNRQSPQTDLRHLAPGRYPGRQPADVCDRMPRPCCVSCRRGSHTTTRFTRTRLWVIVHPVSSSRLTKDLDRPRPLDRRAVVNDIVALFECV
jgi:hypothetical protein